MKKIIFFIFIIAILISCSTSEDDKETPIIINSIDILEHDNRSPKSTEFQIDLELSAKMDAKNTNQDISYQWYVESIDIDIDNNSSNYTNDNSSDFSQSKKISYSNYFIEVSKNPLNILLSIYKPGFYKITLIATNLIETKEKTIIVKVGDPKLPSLQLKFNIPSHKDLSADDFRGKFFMRYNNTGKKLKDEAIKIIDAENINYSWFDTGIEINPFKPFIIETGTHILEDKKQYYLASLSKNSFLAGCDGIYYDYLDISSKEILISPIILKNISENIIIKIYRKGSYKWDSGDIFLSNLMWGYDEEGKSKFITSTNTLNKDNLVVSSYLNNKFLVKLFVGSVGHKVMNNDYFVYFSTDGLDTDELDTQKKREISGLPYGHLLGRLGTDGKVFPIGTKFNYLNSNIIPIYEKSEYGDYKQYDLNNNTK